MAVHRLVVRKEGDSTAVDRYAQSVPADPPLLMSIDNSRSPHYPPIFHQGLSQYVIQAIAKTNFIAGTNLQVVKSRIESAGNVSL